jgi:hypothetical protein
MTTWGDLSDFKHFLPRMLELAALLDCPYEVFILFSKLEHAHWEAWDEKEREAVRIYMEALWEFMLSSYTERVNAEFFDYFVALFRFHPSIARLLSFWERSEEIEPILHLCDLVTEHLSCLEERKKSASGFSLGPRAPEVREWVFSPAASGKIERAFFAGTAGEYEQKLSDAHLILSRGVHQQLPPHPQ